MNSPEYGNWVGGFTQVVKELGLVPIFYAGAGREIVPQTGKSHTLHNEIVDDFYFAKTTVLYFGPHNPGQDYEDHWVLSELQAFLARGREPIIYVSPSYPTEILREYGLSHAATIVADPAEFTSKLRKDLQRVLQEKSDSPNTQ